MRNKRYISRFCFHYKGELNISANWECKLSRNESDSNHCYWTPDDQNIWKPSFHYTYAPNSNIIENNKTNNRFKQAPLVKNVHQLKAFRQKSYKSNCRMCN